MCPTHRRLPEADDRPGKRLEFAVFAYCLMPDHVHLLAHGMSEHADLRRFAKRTKQSSGQRYRRSANEP